MSAAFNHSDQSQHNILTDSPVNCLSSDFMEGKGICHCDQRPAVRDMLSNLPDALISQMLSYLPTKEAVRTSVLSNRWKSLWLFVSGLDLDSRQFPDYNAFVGFVDRFLDFSREQRSCLHNLKLSIHKDDNDQFCVTRWIDFVATRKLKRFDVEFGPVYREYLEVIPLSLFICETLLHLRLHRVVLRKFESVSLPRLKTMLLEHNVYANEVVMESLISSCPVLEDLSIVRCVYDNVMVVRVHSQTLTSLSLEFDNDVDEDEDEEDDNFDQENLAVSIDAPRLEHLNFEDEISPSITISNSDSLTTVNIFGDFDLWSIHEHADLQKRHMIRKFLTSISGVRELNITSLAFWIFSSWLKVEPLPQFCNLSRLEVALYYSLERLRTFLESCPNLKSLILTLLYYSPLKEQIVVSSVPQCLLSSLESVEITNINSKDPAEIDVVTRYFVENSGVLKKLVLRCKSSTIEEDPVFLGKLLALPRRSSECQIEYVAERLVL